MTGQAEGVLPLTDETLPAETWAQLRAAFPAYEDDQLTTVINLPRFQREQLTQLAHWAAPDPDCDHCWRSHYEFACDGIGPFTDAEIDYWNESEVPQLFERRLLATIDAKEAQVKVLTEALEEIGHALLGLSLMPSISTGLPYSNYAAEIVDRHVPGWWKDSEQHKRVVKAVHDRALAAAALGED